MEVLSEPETDSVLKFLGFGLTSEKVVATILKHRKFYSPAGVRRDVERIRIKLKDTKQNAGETF